MSKTFTWLPHVTAVRNSVGLKVKEEGPAGEEGEETGIVVRSLPATKSQTYQSKTVSEQERCEQMGKGGRKEAKSTF